MLFRVTALGISAVLRFERSAFSCVFISRIAKHLPERLLPDEYTIHELPASRIHGVCYVTGAF